MLAIIRVRHDGRKPLSLWIPLILIWILLLPLAPVLLLAALFICAVKQIDPVRAMGAFFGFICALTGTHIDIEDGHSQVKVVIR